MVGSNAQNACSTRMRAAQTAASFSLTRIYDAFADVSVGNRIVSLLEGQKRTAGTKNVARTTEMAHVCVIRMIF